MYKKMYLCTFNAITDALELLAAGKVEEAKKKLMDAQCEAEEIYMSAEDNEDGAESNEGNAMVILPSMLDE